MQQDTFQPDDVFKARVDDGRALADDGDLGGAELVFRELLAEARGHDGNETYVLASLMTIYSRGGRAFEALVLARFLADRLREGESLERAAGCLAGYCETLADLRAYGPLGNAVEELGGLLEEIPIDQATMARESYHVSQARLAVVDGEFERARDHAEEYRALTPEGETRTWRKPYVTWLIDVQMDLLNEAPRRALETVGRMRELDIPESGVKLVIGRARVRCYEALHDHGEALREARALLDLLAELETDPFLAPERIRTGAWLGGWFAEHAGTADDARKAYDLAAAAVILRIAQLDACVRDLPELGLAQIAQTPDLVEIRKAFVKEQGELMKRVATFLKQNRETLGRLQDDATSEHYVRICAWCERVCVDGSVWLPVGHFVPRHTSLQITHSICPGCAAGIR